MTPEDIADRCERVEGYDRSPNDRDLITAVAYGNTVAVEVQGYYGGTQRFRITVEEVTE